MKSVSIYFLKIRFTEKKYTLKNVFRIFNCLPKKLFKKSYMTIIHIGNWAYVWMNRILES